MTSENPAEIFAADRAQRAALVSTARRFTGLTTGDLGTLDTVEALTAGTAPDLYSRQVSLTTQRVRYYGALLAEAVEEHGRAALIRENLVFDPERGEVVVASESPTALVELEHRERRLLDTQMATAVRLGELERRTREENHQIGERQAALMLAVLEQAGLDPNSDQAREMAQRAVIAVCGEEPG